MLVPVAAPTVSCGTACTYHTECSAASLTGDSSASSVAPTLLPDSVCGRALGRRCRNANLSLVGPGCTDTSSATSPVTDPNVSTWNLHPQRHTTCNRTAAQRGEHGRKENPAACVPVRHSHSCREHKA
jgi:hypothetical protein